MSRRGLVKDAGAGRLRGPAAGPRPPARPEFRPWRLPTVTAAARRRPNRAAQRGSELLTSDRITDDNAHLMKLVSCA